MALLNCVRRSRRWLLSHVARRELAIKSSKPLISFTFDDFPRTALFTGGAILKNASARGTFYAAPSLMGKTTEVGQIFVRGDLDQLLQEGHELGSHTFSHVSARDLSAGEFGEEINRGFEVLAKDLGLAASRNFSYPFGVVTTVTKWRTGHLMQSCRGIFGGVNKLNVDLNLLQANRLYGGMEQLKPARALIREAVTRKGWLIFCTHDVQEQPSEYGCTPEMFEQVVALAAESGATVATVEEVLKST